MGIRLWSDPRSMERIWQAIWCKTRAPSVRCRFIYSWTDTVDMSTSKEGTCGSLLEHVEVCDSMCMMDVGSLDVAKL